MHPMFGALLFLSAISSACISTTYAKDGDSTTCKGPASYLESGAPIVIISHASLPVDIRCRAPNAPGEASGRGPRSTLKPADHWNLNFAPGLEDPLYCTFQSALRRWNCDERWVIKDACLWECSGPLISTPRNQNSECPRCENRNGIGKPICVWTIEDDGIYVRQWDEETREDRSELRHSWREDDPAFYAPTSPFRFSVTNYFHHTVKIQCDVVSEAVFLEGFKEGGVKPQWQYEIDPVVDEDFSYFTWTCDFDVLGTEFRRGGEQIWSPPPDVNTWIRSPDCVDCAWKLDVKGLWLDDRSCYTDNPVWVKEHLWDSVINHSNGPDDNVDCTPYYYPLKRSSHVYHI